MLKYLNRIKYICLKTFVFFIVLLLLSSCGFLEKKDKSLETKNLVQEKQQFEKQLTPEVENEKVDINNSLFCKSANQKESEECLERVKISNAVNSHKENACEDLGVERMIKKCKSKLLIYDAIISENPSACENMANAGEKILCINNVNLRRAFHYMDIKYCNMLSYEADKKECIGIVNKNSN